jgi:hypothetical protein
MTRISNLQSIYDCFPKGVKPPERLIQLVKYILGTPYAQETTFPGFEGDLLNDYWIENGSLLAHKFGLFIHQADGTLAGYWFYEGCDIENAPIVILGSGSGQYQVEVIANSIEDFASRIVEGKTGLYDFDGVLDEENYDDDDDPDEFWGWDVRGWLVDLGNWLEESWGITSVMRQKFIEHDPKDDHPNLQEWFNRWTEEQQNIEKQKPIYPILQEIHRVLSKYLPESTNDYMKVFTSTLYTEEKNLTQTEDMMKSLFVEGSLSWVSASFDVLIVGKKFEIWRRSIESYQPVQEICELEPLFREVRNENANQAPEQGLWFSAYVDVNPDGNVKVTRFDETDPPNFLGEIPSRENYMEDLLKFPRSNEFVPNWLNEIIHRSQE